MGHHREAVEVAKTVLEVADVTFAAVEYGHHYLHHKHHNAAVQEPPAANCPSDEEELQSLRSENRRLRNLLEQNLKLLQNLSESPSFLNNCPSDLHDRLVSTVESDEYLAKLKLLQQEGFNGAMQFPFKEATELDHDCADILINVDSQQPSWWVWVTDDLEPSNAEERSGIDDESYIVISEEHVVDGVANFMARCILSNPKALKLSPEQLQKVLSKALAGTSKLETVFNIWEAGKLFYALSTWGLALAGLYKSRAVLRVAAKGIHSGSKLALKAL
ncbi:hypothetical protein HN51_052636 [Arachis hypogaea]|uniref:Uncharacterized protein n=1 Tax=Arachis hypogaea TaxID=3818 RepID=A0A445C9W1_ARAHY|nr:uncharacterized protein LOC107606067 isoform X1 [Arachis ipaensis]XP_025666710.1 uncharacterized protein LOC112765063 isoform X1 [Arachis hypogaea]QHN94023.1 uncharacterized protein DS421_17g597720 [Arachis hypogaea]RYR47728.1 hypothetical protein Ahy_A07g033687 isoform B [Arachis hypogaea]